MNDTVPERRDRIPGSSNFERNLFRWMDISTQIFEAMNHRPCTSDELTPLTLIGYNMPLFLD